MLTLLTIQRTKFMKKILTIFSLLFFSNAANAAEITAWKIIPAQSNISFKVTQDATPILGSFKKFNGQINFDKAQLAKSNITIEVETASVTSSLVEASGTLQSPEWMSSKAFPKAVFTANKFTQNGKGYKAEGKLTIKGKSVPTTLDFTLEEYSATKARAVGTTTIKRTAFAVGDADVKKANGVKDDVEITFTINAEK